MRKNNRATRTTIHRNRREAVRQDRAGLDELEPRLLLSAGVVAGGGGSRASAQTIAPFGPAAKLAFITPPSNVTSTALSTVSIAVEDAVGNVVTTDTSTITIALAGGGGGATLGGTLTQTAVKGVATFSGLSLNAGGTFYLRATDGVLVPSTSNGFNVSFIVIPEYRLYLGKTAEHLYTTDANEYATLATRGWSQEGVAYNVYTGPAVVTDVKAVPYYRLYNPKILQHLWTTDANEYNTLAGRGWSQEGVDCYLFAASGTPISGLPVPNSQPLYRLNLNTKTSDFHLWTTDLNEYTTLATSYGWTQEGIIGYVLTQASG